MCAAPGSKTAQIIEALHSENEDNKDTSVVDGLVIANDADQKRAYLLVHQAKRLSSPCLLVTNNDASSFPRILLGDSNAPLRFDRVLCDVPCSGDGTLRKNPILWKRWSLQHALGLHKLQIRIFERGFHLLEVGGRIVYSTCSFNPIENEAVVAEILRKFGSKKSVLYLLKLSETIKLLDVSNELLPLKRRHGLNSWNVLNKDGTVYERYEDVPEILKKSILPSMFPPTTEEQLKFSLDKWYFSSFDNYIFSIRIMPQDSDTGGFFIAVFSRTEESTSVSDLDLTVEETLEEPIVTELEETVEVSSKPESIIRTPYTYKEEPFIFLDNDDKDLCCIK